MPAPAPDLGTLQLSARIARASRPTPALSLTPHDPPLGVLREALPRAPASAALVPPEEPTEPAGTLGPPTVHVLGAGQSHAPRVEAVDQVALGCAMKGLGVRLARGLNRLMNGRRGQVLADRYHAHILRTLSEVRRAVTYVRHNHQRHALERGDIVSPSFVDDYSSASSTHGIPLPDPHTWLLRQCLAAPASENLTGTH